MSLPFVKLKRPTCAALFILNILILTAPSEAYFRNRLIGHLGMGRIDPIMSPGTPSQHIHHLSGASNIGFETDADLLSASNCTTSILTQDKSAYWAPWMYFKHADGTFEPVNLTGGLTVYYKLEKRTDVVNGTYAVFPRGFSMVAGSSNKRTWNGPWPVPQTSFWGPQDLTQEALAEKAIGFNCLNYCSTNNCNEPTFAYPWLRNKNFIDESCPDGIRSEILFPSCWDGVNLDSADHKSHVAYPPTLQEGKCPGSHPVYLPIMFFETVWNTPPFKDIPGEFVMANGDPTGFGYHADFVAAWDENVLQSVMDDPTCTSQDPNHPNPNISGEVETCKTFEGHIQLEGEAGSCQLEIPEAIRGEQVKGLLHVLPGNVKVTGTRHDPGTQPDDQVPAPIEPSSTTASVSPTFLVPSPPALPPIATSVKTSNITDSTPVPTAMPISIISNGLVTTTTTFTSEGYVVEMVLIQDIETITLITTPTTTVTITITETSSASNNLPSLPVADDSSFAHQLHARKHAAHMKQGHAHL